MAEPTTSGLTLWAFIVGAVSAIAGGLIDSEWSRVIFCAYVGATGGLMAVSHVNRWQKGIDWLRWTVVGVIISSPTCYFLSLVTGMPFQTWPGFVTCVGTWFLVWFFENFKAEVKGLVKVIMDGLIRRVGKSGKR